MSCQTNRLMNFGFVHLTIDHRYLCHPVHRLCLYLFQQVKSSTHAGLVVRVTNVYEAGLAWPEVHLYCRLTWCFISCGRGYSNGDLQSNCGLSLHILTSLAHIHFFVGVAYDLNYFEFLCQVIFRTLPMALPSRTICEQSALWMVRISLWWRIRCSPSLGFWYLLGIDA